MILKVLRDILKMRMSGKSTTKKLARQKDICYPEEWKPWPSSDKYQLDEAMTSDMREEIDRDI